MPSGIYKRTAIHGEKISIGQNASPKIFKKGVLKKCYCGKEYYEFPYQKEKKKFCSKKCSNKFNAPKLSKARKGIPTGRRPWNYIDGKTQNRWDLRYWIWRRQVFEKFKYICQCCFKKFARKKLIAHHIKGWTKYPEFRYIVENGLALCRPCHNKIDDDIKRGWRQP